MARCPRGGKALPQLRSLRAARRELVVLLVSLDIVLSVVLLVVEPLDMVLVSVDVPLELVLVLGLVVLL